jgi:hypothetical protein
MSGFGKKRRVVRSVQPLGGFVFPKRGWRDRRGAHLEEIRRARFRAKPNHRPKSPSATKGDIVMSEKKKMQLLDAVQDATGDGPTTEWTRIGIAVQNDDGSFDLRFDYLPMRLAETAIEMREMDAMATAQTE